MKAIPLRKAAELAPGDNYRDDHGTYRRVKTVTATPLSVVVQTDRGRFVFRKSDMLRITP